MKTSTKFAGYLFAAGVMAMSPISAFAAEGAGTNGLTFYDYLAANADKDTVIDFNEAPATGNVVDEATGAVMSDIGGLYMLQSTKNDAKPMYFFRGNVTDNNVILNDMCWLIVRTTETGGTKLLYNGTPTDGQCLGDPDWTADKTIAAINQMYSGNLPSEWPKTNIGASQYNAGYNSPSDMYYMYGNRYESTSKRFTSDTVFGNDVTYSNGQYTLQDTITGASNAYNAHHYTCLSTSTTCSEVYYENYRYSATDTSGDFLTFADGDTLETALAKMAENKHDSIAKTTLENWYAEQMTGVTDYLEDTVWYGDKTYATGSLATKDADFGSNYDSHGLSYPTTTVDVFYHGASREADSDLTNPTVNDVSFDYTDPDSIYTVANGTLKYPVGLLTSSEMIMAGNGYPAAAKGTYIDDNFVWWGLSPFVFSDYYAYAGVFNGYVGASSDGGVVFGLGVRPVVSLKSTLGAFDGDGSRENPFAALAEISGGEDEEDETPAEGETTPTNPQTSDIFLPATLAVVVLSSAAFVAVKRNTLR